MKILSLTLLFSLPVLADEVKWNAKPDAELLSEQGFIYTALDVQIKKLAKKKELESSELELLEELVLKASVEALEDYDSKVLSRFPIASVQFLLGRQAYYEKKTKSAREWLINVPKWHRYYPEARFLLADMSYDAKEMETSDAFEEQCVSVATSRANEVNSKILKRYYTVLAEDCLALKGRKLYKQRKFKEAIEAYGRVSKRAYKWPSLLLEKAWAFYNLQDFNRTLGLLVTYKAPLMDNYFFPEAEVLTALGYFNLCLYDDALVVIDQFYNNYKPRTEALERMLASHKNSQTHFFELMQLSGQKKKELHPFIAQLTSQIAFRPRFALDRSSLAKVQEESNRLAQVIKALPETHPAHGWMKDATMQLAAVNENLIGRINFHAKKDMFQFISEVYALSEELFKIKLEIISRKKDLVYGSKKLISDRGRGSFSQVRHTRFEAFWKFHGAFWADELGDFSFGLASNCQAVRKEEAPRE